MQFIVSRNALLRALQHVRCAIINGETLKAISAEKVVLLFIDPSRAVLIQPQPDNEEITMLIMPMLCND